jgi:class 3 adenylate cyclase
MKRLVIGIVNTGIDETTPQSNVRCIQITNVIAGFAPVCWLAMGSNYILLMRYSPRTALFCVAAAALWATTLAFNSRRKYFAAKFYVEIVTLLCMASFPFFLRPDSMFHFVLMIPLMCTFFIFSPSERGPMVFFVLCYIAAFAALEIRNNQALIAIGDIRNTKIPAYPLSNIPVMVILTIFGAYIYSIVKAAEAKLKLEQERSETLLLNVLPKPIAERLKSNPDIIADSFSEASILFADIVNFTPLSQQLRPGEVVQLLNDVFSRFDEHATKYGLEKIKTIGDAYMIASGIPVEDSDHLVKILDFALDIRDEVLQSLQKAYPDLSLRIGVNSGPVVAGVIGRSKFIYDLWGDAVNTASRMESQGCENQIQVTQDVCDKMTERYRFEERGVIEVKGKGPMKTHFLVGRNRHPSR